MDVVTPGEGGGEGWVEEIPHKRGGVEEVDGCDTERHSFQYRDQGQDMRDQPVAVLSGRLEASRLEIVEGFGDFVRRLGADPERGAAWHWIWIS